MNNYITKIEGHGSLETDWSSGKVELHIHEGERLFEGLLVGRTIEESHWITPRICGVCPIAHNLASLMACEDALSHRSLGEGGVPFKISENTSLLRDLMTCAQMMQSHALHLFFLSLPDYLGIDRGTELHKKNPKAFKSALDIKEVSDEIATIVAGRNVHPTTTTIGGFHKVPTKKELKNLLEKIKKTRKSAEHTLELVSKIEFPELKVDLEFVALSSQDNVKTYKESITEEIRSYSTAKFGSYKGRTVMVGALARLYHNPLNPPYLKGGNERGDSVPPLKVRGGKGKLDFQNPFHNNLAQAIEILMYHEQAEQLLIKLINNPFQPPNITPPYSSPYDKGRREAKGLIGIGAIEAPRGGLYHEFHFTTTSDVVGESIITYANIITPTVQNLTSIEKSAQALLEQCLSRAKSRETIKRLLNMLVRAYDPCITCSVH